MYHREYINPYYLEKLNKDELREIQKYILNLSDSDYKLSEFEHYDGFEDKKYDKYQEEVEIGENLLIKQAVGGATKMAMKAA